MWSGGKNNRRGRSYAQRPTTANKPIIVNKQIQVQHLCMWLPISDAVRAYIVANATNEHTSTPDRPDTVELKTHLNDAKSRMDPVYSSKDPQITGLWYRFGNVVDIYRDLKKTVKSNHVTNAWLKYWEIYTYHDVIRIAPADDFVAFFNAELPGAALSSCVHYFAAHDRSLDWRASSIAPTGSGDSSDNLGDNYGFYAHNVSKWLMDITGAPGSNNGDATILSNLKDYENKLGVGSPFGGVHLYSHDAGIDVSGTNDSGGLNFNDQEMSNAKIHMGCAMAGLMTLRRGGMFVAKQYTFFERFTIDLIIIYAALFDEFAISKPLTSRAANSEIYLIGRGYRGYDDNVRRILENRLEKFHTGGFFHETPILDKINDEIARAGRIIHGQQTAIINENMDIWDTQYQNPQGRGHVENALEKCKKRQIGDWLTLYPVPNVPAERLLAGN